MKKISLKTLGFAFIFLNLISVKSFSHHGWSGNTAGEIVITGEVEKEVRLRGPHGTMQIRDRNGNRWQLTLAPGPRTHRAGLKENTIPIGETVTVRGARNADMGEYEAKIRQVEWKGNIFQVYPSR